MFVLGNLLIGTEIATFNIRYIDVKLIYTIDVFVLGKLQPQALIGRDMSYIEPLFTDIYLITHILTLF